MHMYVLALKASMIALVVFLFLQAILCNLPGYRTIPAPFQTVKIGTVTVFFYIVKIFNNIFTTLN